MIIRSIVPGMYFLIVSLGNDGELNSGYFNNMATDQDLNKDKINRLANTEARQVSKCLPFTQRTVGK